VARWSTWMMDIGRGRRNTRQQHRLQTTAAAVPAAGDNDDNDDDNDVDDVDMMLTLICSSLSTPYIVMDVAAACT